VARSALGLPPLPANQRTPLRTLADKPVSDAERKQLTGTFLLKLDRLSSNLHDSFTQYRRTYRVFDENGRLMIEPLGEAPERLLKQEDGSFAMHSAPSTHVTFILQNDRAQKIKMESQGFPLAGDRVGNGDPQTFHQTR
jgi:hypothetical protein